MREKEGAKEERRERRDRTENDMYTANGCKVVKLTVVTYACRFSFRIIFWTPHRQVTLSSDARVSATSKRRYCSNSCTNKRYFF